MILLRNTDGLTFEVGFGNDLWRWQKGMLRGLGENVYQVSINQGSVLIDRIVSKNTPEETIPESRCYRFNWYCAWGKDEDLKDPIPSDGYVLNTRPNGDLAVGALVKHLQENPDTELVLDFHKLVFPETAYATNGQPCFAANTTIKRIKKLFRKLTPVLEEFGYPKLMFRNFTPKSCKEGQHVSRPGETLHWDLSSLLELALWIRQAVNEDQKLIIENKLGLPSLAGMFELSDHEVPPIQYYYDPDKELEGNGEF